MTSRMAYNQYKSKDISPKGLVYLCLMMGLVAIIYSIVTQRWIIFASVLASPAVIFVVLTLFKNPVWSYALIGIVCCYFAALSRYTNISGISVVIDLSVYFCVLVLFVSSINPQKKEDWKKAINILTVTQLVWILYCVFSLFSPYTSIHSPVAVRSFFTTLPLLYILSAIFMCTTKRMKYALFLIGLFTVTVAFKALWQKRKGFDSVELNWLINEGAWHTHVLPDGLRYFSLFSDAANFGVCMGAFTIVFALLTFIVKDKINILFCLGTAILSAMCMFMSGTRGAIAVPLAGLLLYTLLCKNLKLLIINATVGIGIFSFFYFTDLGNDNSYIRRMRTAFRPTDDASFNVRLMNQKRLAYYLQERPFGVGVGERIVDTKGLAKEEMDEEFIPTDSSYVDIWVEGGIVGLCLYISLLAIVLLRCAYLLMFTIHNDQLRKILAAMLSGVFGVWVSGYVGRAMGFQPTLFFCTMFLAFVLNGASMDKQLTKNQIIA